MILRVLKSSGLVSVTKLQADTAHQCAKRSRASGNKLFRENRSSHSIAALRGPFVGAMRGHEASQVSQQGIGHHLVGAGSRVAESRPPHQVGQMQREM